MHIKLGQNASSFAPTGTPVPMPDNNRFPKAQKRHSQITVVMVRELEARLTHSSIVTPGSQEYTQSIKRWSDAAEKQAAAVLYPRSAQDVATAVSFCHERDIELVVAGGKHSTSGASSTLGGLVIDLAKLRHVSVDVENETLFVQGGATWKDVDEAAAIYGLATVGGTVNDTGVGGLTLGGGYGWLSGRYGLTIDNLLQVTIVLADGNTVTASETENPDLFWAVRGAGQCFGVVLDFTFQAFQMKRPVFAGQMVFPADNKTVDAVIDFANNLMALRDPDAALIVTFTSPPFMKGCAVIATLFYNGPERKARSTFAPFLGLKPLVNNTTMRAYVEVNGMLNHAVDWGGSKLTKGACFVTPISAQFVRTLIKELDDFRDKIPETKRSQVNLEFYSPDALCKLPQSATSFGNRGRHHNAMVAPFWTSREHDTTCRIWARRVAAMFTTELEKVRTERGDPATMADIKEYSNYDGLMSTPRDVFGSNYDTLVKLKAKYDPDNVFRSSYQLVPSNSTSGYPNSQ